MIDKAKLTRIPRELQQQYALGQRIYSFNIVYNTNSMPKAKHPRNWAEVWDAKTFPGGRTFNFQGGIAPQLEAALLADGVPVDKLYPLDVERAWRMMDKLKPIVAKWYTSHAQAIQLLSAGEASVGNTIGPRGITAKKAGAPVDVEYNQAKLASDNWCCEGRAQQEGSDGVHQHGARSKRWPDRPKGTLRPSNTGAFEFLLRPKTPPI